MKIYVTSLGAGLLVGVIYGLINVRSPAPPVIALVGLLGILLGEQIPPLVKKALAGSPVNASVVKQQCAEPLFGQLPSAGRTPPTPDRPAG